MKMYDKDSYDQVPKYAKILLGPSEGKTQVEIVDGKFVKVETTEQPVVMQSTDEVNGLFDLNHPL